MRLRPGFLIAFSFFLVILGGAYLLSLPMASASGTPTKYVDAFFTANSALSVTGLTVLDIGSHFSFLGQCVILFLIQLGGLAMMTFSTFLVLIFRKKMFVSEKLMMMETLNVYSARDVWVIMRRILALVFIVEALGAVILFLCFLPEKGLGQATFWGIFHAISAFNNAGFALTANNVSLIPYVGDWMVNLTIAALVIIGGIGFMVVTDLLRFKRWALHSKVVIVTTIILILSGIVIFLALEYSNPTTLATLSWPNKILASFFQSVTPRTAGFHTVPIDHLAPATALLLMVLMFIGASPGGTGGGIKTVTGVLVLATIWATLRNSRNTVIFNRRIPPETVRRAITITFLALMFITAAVFCLNYLEPFNLTQLTFEVLSAFSSVGLSLGITPLLSSWGKIIIIIVMFVGRIGIISLLFALMAEQKDAAVEPPKEGISIG